MSKIDLLPSHIRQELSAAIIGSASNGDAMARLIDFKLRYSIPDADVAKLEAELRAKKAAAKKAVEARENPDFIDKGVSPWPIRETFLVFTSGAIKNAVALDMVLTGNMPVTALYNSKFHRAPEDSEATFEYLCSIVKDIGAGILKPKQLPIVGVRQSDERFRYSELSIIDSGRPGLGLDLRHVQLIRLPDQTPSRFETAVKALQKELEKRGNMNVMKPELAGSARY